jgi:hypothetical protein
MGNNVHEENIKRNAVVTKRGANRRIGGAVFCKRRGCALSPNKVILFLLRQPVYLYTK